MKNCEKKGSSSAICVQGTRGAGGGRQKTIRDAPCQCMETGTLGRRNWTTPSLQERLQPQGSHVPRLSTTNPQAPDSQRSPGIGGNRAFLERDKPLPVQEVLGQARKFKSQERLRDESPPKPSKKQGMCPFGGGCEYVRKWFKGLDIFWSLSKASSREFVEQTISRGCKHLLKR